MAGSVALTDEAEKTLEKILGLTFVVPEKSAVIEMALKDFLKRMVEREK